MIHFGLKSRLRIRATTQRTRRLSSGVLRGNWEQQLSSDASGSRTELMAWFWFLLMSLAMLVELIEP